ncbi:MAG: translation elongation factor Ts [Acutalibacteraceae bacterium]
MSFTAKDVQALREKTGVGMMDCKKALQASDGDMDKAIDFLREKGLAAAMKKSTRVAAEGAVLAYNDEDKKVGVVVEVNSETDFVAKNEVFQAFVLDIAKTIAAENPADVDALLNVKLAGSDRTVQENLQDKVLSIGENLKIRRFVRHEGIVSTYVHMGGSVGVMVYFDTDDATAAKPEFKAMGKDVAMQIAAMSPLYLCREEVPADVIEHEKSINLAQIKEDPKMANKPEKVIDGIINGKIAKFCKESCLLEQQFVKDGDLNVAKYIDNTAKELGASVKATGFVRYAKGEGLQKKEENYAEEIAKMTGNK